MILIIGGMAQGKLDYVLSQTGYTKNDVAFDFLSALNRPILYGLHDLVAECLKSDGNPEEEVNKIVDENPEIIIICDELGCGVVPLDPFERKWRDWVGRICCELAKNAQRVERILCGLPMILKGGDKWN